MTYRQWIINLITSKGFDREIAESIADDVKSEMGFLDYIFEQKIDHYHLDLRSPIKQKALSYIN